MKLKEKGEKSMTWILILRKLKYALREPFPRVGK